MMKSLSILLGVGLASVAGMAIGAPIDVSKLPPVSAKAVVTYATDIRPLLEASCVRCHGAERPKAGLRLDSLDAILKGGKEGKVVVSGSSEKSKIVLAISRLDRESAMPPFPKGDRRRDRAASPEGTPASTNAPAAPAQRPPAKPLTADEVGLVRAWIDQGVK